MCQVFFQYLFQMLVSFSIVVLAKRNILLFLISGHLGTCTALFSTDTLIQQCYFLHSGELDFDVEIRIERLESGHSVQIV